MLRLALIFPGKSNLLTTRCEMFSERLCELQGAIKSCIFLDGSQHELIENDALESAFCLIEKTRASGGVVYVIGNGGSAGIASHFSTDLMKSLEIASSTLFDSNLMTCLGNDYGYATVFSYPLSHLLKPHDLLVAISSSGKSPNILSAVEVARSKQVPVITLSGFSKENPLKKLGTLNFWIDRCDYGLVETAHFFLLHTIADLWNRRHLTENKNAEFSRNCTEENQAFTRH